MKRPVITIDHIAVKQIGAARFKAECLKLLDELTPEGMVITKRGKPVARVVPYPESPAGLIGSMEGQIEIRGGILTTGLRWGADD